VVGPQDALDVGEGLQLQLEGPTEIAGRQVCVGEVVARGEGVGVIGPSTRCLSVRVCSCSGMARPRFPADSQAAAKLLREARVSGWSGPSTRSRSVRVCS
jgi:hypothetical protein